MKRLIGCALVVVLVRLHVFAQGGPPPPPPPDPEKQELLKEIQELKDQQHSMQDNFDKRIQALEDKLAKQGKAQVAPPKAPMLSGFGPIQFDGLLQTRFDTDSHGNDTFFLRRIELKLSGKIGPKTDWTVMVDPAKNLSLSTTKVAGNVTVSVNQSSRILQDA